MSVINKTFSTTVFMALLATPFLMLWQRQYIYDQWRLHNYIPPASIADLASSTTMNALGKKIFYVERPKLQDIGTFRINCTTSEQTIVLGCYKSGAGIFVYDVKDSRLSGIQQVTAAHEMLHAAYDRLSSNERDHINKLTAQAYALVKNDRITKNVDAYRAKDPTVVPNELHSILGTEVVDLPYELEMYYKRYFEDRLKIVALSEQYESEFTNRESVIKDYDAQLVASKSTIDSLNSSLDAQGKGIDSASSRLQTLLNAHDVATYNAGIPNYQQLIRKYNQDLATLKKTIANYNTIVEKRNAIVGEERTLFDAIDTRVPASR